MSSCRWEKDNPNYKHGLSETSTYRTWNAMIQRCTNPENPAFKDYGGRDIKVCDRWKSFVNFFADMGLKPEGLTIERVDNDKGYFKGNCKWATRKEQACNRRPYKVYEVRKDSKTGIAGVFWEKRCQKYRVQKTIQGKRISLGYFTNLNEAASTLKTFNEGGRI